MSHSHVRDSRTRGGRVCMNEAIRNVAQGLSRLDRSDFYDLCRTVAATTSLLKPESIRSARRINDVTCILTALGRLATHRYRFYRSTWSTPSFKNMSLHEQWTAIVRHWIEPYPLPTFLSHAWLDLHTGDWEMNLHLSLADGISLRRIALPDGSYCNKVVARHFMQAPSDATPIGALRYAQTMSLAEQARREAPIDLARYATLRFGYSENTQSNAFWNGLLRWMERERPTMEALDDLYHVLITLRFTTASEEFGPGYPERIIDPEIDVSDWSLRRAKRFLANWRKQYQSKLAAESSKVPNHHRPWSKVRIPDATLPIENAFAIEIVQLNTAYELSVEGNRMSHCVATYASRCRRGYSAIFALRIVRHETSQPSRCSIDTWDRRIGSPAERYFERRKLFRETERWERKDEDFRDFCETRYFATRFASGAG